MYEVNKKAKQWLEDNRSWVTSYINERVSAYSHEYVRDEFDKNPFIGYQVVSYYKNNKTNIHINQQKLIKTIREKDSCILTVGYKSREKAWWILNELKDEFNIKVIMPVESDNDWATPIPKQLSMPVWATPTPIPIGTPSFNNRDFVFYDELNLFSVSHEIREMSIRSIMDSCPETKIIYSTEARCPDFNTSMFNIIISEGCNTFAYGRAKDHINALDNQVIDYIDLSSLKGKNYLGFPSSDWGIVTDGKDNYLVYMPSSLPIVKDAIHFSK